MSKMSDRDQLLRVNCVSLSTASHSPEEPGTEADVDTRSQSSITGETDLQSLLSEMSPILDPRSFVFVCIDEKHASEYIGNAQMVFREAEGISLILEEPLARARGLTSTFSCRMITLQIYSSLDAVGFLAAVLPALARSGLGVNPVSACFHDHLFVPAARAEEALKTLQGLQAQ